METSSKGIAELPASRWASSEGLCKCASQLAGFAILALFLSSALHAQQTADTTLTAALTAPSDTSASTASTPLAGEEDHHVNPEDLAPLFRATAATSWLAEHRVRAYGWADGGCTYSSSGHGLLNIAATPNRFGNECQFDEGWITMERPTVKDQLSWGYRVDFYGGQVAALLRPMNNFGPQDTHAGTDFRQVMFTARIPGKRPWDLQLGRQNMPLGYETLMAPYRPLYSMTYFWIKFQVAATAALATWHPTPSLDILAGSAAGYNTMFELRGRAPDYLSKVTYRPHNSTRTSFFGTVFTGPRPAPTAAGHTYDWQTVLDVDAKHAWNERIKQSIQFNSSWATKDIKNDGNTSATHGANTIAVFRLNRSLDLNTRGEWFYDAHGVRTGTAGHFGEAAMGTTYMPSRWIEFRPEIRGDFAGQPSFGPVGASHLDRNQLTVAGDLIFKFSAIR